MTDRLEEIEQRWAEATPGPWYNEPDTHAGRVWVQRKKRWVGRVTDIEPLFNVRGPDEYAQRSKDAAAVAAAPEDIAWLIARVRELESAEVPRLPTRSEVEHALSWHRSEPETVAVNTATAQRIATDFVARGWAVDDPEPEVDPAQVEALAKALIKFDPWMRNAEDTARRLLASSRVYLKP